MPKVKIQKSLSVQADELFKIIQDVLTSDKEVKALEPNLELKPEKSEKGIIGKIKGSRIKGDFKISPESDKSSLVDIELSLPLMLAPFKGLVQKKIEEKLSKLA